MLWYKLVFKQNQQIHIGSLNWGVINETEIFIPGWTIWGALTKAYNIFNNHPLSANQALFETITCFYPCFDKDGNSVLFPNYKDGQFYLGELSENEFRLEFTDVLISTAVYPVSRQAKDGTLHETEFILPMGKKITSNDKSRQLYWVGLVRLNEVETNDFFKKGRKIWVGGEQRYGYGELVLEKKVEEISDLSEWQLNEDASFKVENSNLPLKNYLAFTSEVIFEGEIKPLAEFDFQENTPKIKDAQYYINVGSKVNIKNSIKFILKKGKLIKQGG
ncbi:hypothetical protein TAGGR_2414 [Thermodesulfovibrio aggregans]|uniref:Uncharacterized protein n=1 Tax=Thermodesulfovibrio aggregans TaxID=86166 RepID=A0A0U9HXT2_9BACT|nr:hypothetical protein [Thermodesulfovibrio aggregans]GAQ95519.1 hypothetical protein TAGGR_2414 [Thermodesulfovibrio aggregans]